MYNMDHYENSGPLSVTFKHFNLYYYYPDFKERTHLKKFYLICFALRIFSLIFWVDILLHCYKSTTDMIEVYKDLSIALSATGSLISLFVFIFAYEKWDLLIQKISDHRRFGEPPKYEHSKNLGNIVSTYYMGYIYPGMVAWAILTYIDSKECRQKNIDQNLHNICVSFTPIWPDQGIRLNKFAHGMLYSLQFFSYVLVVPAGALTSLMPWQIVELLAAKMQHLKYMFEHTFDTDDQNEMARNLGICIEYHNHLIECCKELDWQTKLILGHLTLLWALIVAFLGGFMLTAYNFAAFIYVFGWIVTIFFVCHGGQRLTDEASGIGLAVFHGKWYKASPKLGKCLVIILRRSQVPIHLRAFPVGILGYGLYVSVMKSAYSYLTLLSRKM